MSTLLNIDTVSIQLSGDLIVDRLNLSLEPGDIAAVKLPCCVLSPVSLLFQEAKLNCMARRYRPTKYSGQRSNVMSA